MDKFIHDKLLMQKIIISVAKLQKKHYDFSCKELFTVIVTVIKDQN
jgi:hypothetical protein